MHLKFFNQFVKMQMLNFAIFSVLIVDILLRIWGV